MTESPFAGAHSGVLQPLGVEPRRRDRNGALSSAISSKQVYPVDGVFIMTDYEVRKQLLTGEVSGISEPVWLKQMPIEAKNALLLKLLKQVNFLQGLTRQELLKLLCTVRRVAHSPGDVIFREEDPPDGTLYILIAGRVEVLVRHSVSRKENLLTTLMPGQTFGEMALVDGENRSATIRVLDPSVTLRVSSTKLQELPDIAAKIYLNIARILSRRLKEANQAVKNGQGSLD